MLVEMLCKEAIFFEDLRCPVRFVILGDIQTGQKLVFVRLTSPMEMSVVLEKEC